MKQLRIFIALALVALFVESCATSNQVNNGHFFQKRKYTKGFHHGNLRINRSAAESTTTEQIESGKSVSKSESPVKRDVIVERAQAQSETPVVRQSEEETAIAPQAKVPNTGVFAKVKTEKPASAKPKVTSGPGQLRKFIKEERKQAMNRKTQQQLPGGDSDLIFVLCIILAIVLPPIAVLVWTNIDWIKVLIALLLTLLFVLPGIIYALLVVLDKV